MASTVSVMTNVLRNVVSKQRIRYKEKGFNLDLAYICDNIIAMGYPADNYESMYRNPLVDVYKFLEDNHHDHYKIYNLCLERSYDIAKFHGRVATYPFEDHNPPTIELIQNFCNDVDNWLKANELNVAAVHCKAGKGRTGTMICCYLVYCGLYYSADDALACYDEKRTKDRKGVTIPSQRRYVNYFATLMKMGLQYERRTLQFCEIRFAKANTLNNHGAVHCLISVLLEKKVQQLQNFSIDFRKSSVLDMKNPSVPVTGDIKVELTKNNKKVFHFWFNTFFVNDFAVLEGEGSDVKMVYTLKKYEIDDVHKDKSYPDDFKIELVFNADHNNVDRDSRVSAGSRVTSTKRTTQQTEGTAKTSLQHQQQLGPLPKKSSRSSETSVSSSLGVGDTDASNGYDESNHSATGDVVPSSSNHYSSHHMAAKDVNNGVIHLASPPVQQHMALPPNHIEQHQQQQKKQEQHKHNVVPQHKRNQNGGQQNNASMANQRHFQSTVADDNGDDIVGGAVDVHVTRPTSISLNASKSSSINSANIVGNNSYNRNHNHSNSNSNSSSSSKTSSVSSQSSSSSIGDNEEDWESANTTRKTTTQSNTQQNEDIEGTKLYCNFNNISSVDVIKQQQNNNKLNNISGSESNTNKTTLVAAEVAVREKLNETKYNRQQQQTSTKKIVEQQQQLHTHQPSSQQQQQQNICNGLIKNELISKTTNNLINTKSSTLNTNTTTNTNSKTTTSQQFCLSYLQTGDLSSELQCC